MSTAHRDRAPLTPTDEEAAAVWASASARPYLGRLEWQRREGHCANATARCVLRGLLPDDDSTAIPSRDAPPGPASLDRWAADVARASPSLRARVVRGDAVDRDGLLGEITRALTDPRRRVAVNYLRPALVGFASRAPGHAALGVLGGHFSPVVAVLPPSPTRPAPRVAVFDVNAAYGLCLVDADRLRESVRCKDLTTGKARGIVVVELNE